MAGALTPRTSRCDLLGYKGFPEAIESQCRHQGRPSSNVSAVLVKRGEPGHRAGHARGTTHMRMEAQIRDAGEGGGVTCEWRDTRDGSRQQKLGEA